MDFLIESQVKPFATFGDFPAAGAVKTIYIDEATNNQYYWDGLAYTALSDTNKVPYSGAINDLNLGNNDIYVNEVFLYDAVNDNYGSTHYTDGNYHIEDADGDKLLVIEDGFIQLHKTDAIQSNLYTIGLSATRDHYLPDESGTIALTSDLDAKQDELVSGSNIKTVFNQSLLGAGNVGYLHRTFAQGSNVTGTTSEVQVFQLLIPANTFSDTDKLTFFAVFSRVTAVTLVSLRAKISTSATMPSGATGMIARLNPAALNIYAKIGRDMIISGGNVRGVNNNATNVSDVVTSTSALSSQAMDVTVNNYFYLSVQLTAATDDVRLEAVEIKNI
jgi:hypothetical protein